MSVMQIYDLDNGRVPPYETATFSNQKLFDNQVLRTLYLKLVKQSARVSECQARIEFLKNCIELDIIPAGCRVKPKIGGMFSKEHIQKKINQAKADSRRDLSTAVKDSKKKFEFEDSKYIYFKLELFDTETLPAGWKENLETMLSDKSIKQLKSHRKSFQESLEHLQLKSTSQPTIPQAVESESSTQMDEKSEYPIPSIQLL